MKEIFTRKQAVSILIQVKNGIRDVNITAPVDPKEKLFKLTNEELYSRLCKIIEPDNIADVVDEPKPIVKNK